MARILCLAQTAEVFHAEGGVRAVRRVIRRRPGRWFDPALVDRCSARVVAALESLVGAVVPLARAA